MRAIAEYIEREALIAEIQEEIDFETTMYTEEQNKYFNMGLKCALRNVKHQPSADVVEVRHGYWKNNRNGTFICSVCGGKSSKKKWCGDCGAKMDGKE